MSRALRQLGMFGIGGAIGLVVDYGVLELLVLGLHSDRYSARLVSFLCAATATWIFNRRYTFHGPRRYSLFGEWTRYIIAMSGGFACNYAAYSALVYFFNFDGYALFFAVAAGSVAGMGVNFVGSRYWVYRHHRQPPSGPSGAAPK
jgi:putative flippase GtrA